MPRRPRPPYELIDRSGKVVDSYPSKVTPDDKKLVGALEKALAM